MSDIFNETKRSQVMAQVKSIDTKPELAIRKFLFAHGFRYRKNVKKLSGKPDIVLSKYKTIIFIHGCFWHGHKNCEASTLPKSRKEYWAPKIQGNINRDLKNKKLLRKLGWQIITIWECDIKKITTKDSKRQLALLNSIKRHS